MTSAAPTSRATCTPFDARIVSVASRGVGRAAAAAKTRANASPKSSSATTTPPVRAASGATRDALAASRPQAKTSTETRREATWEV
jgi:hypothetical protein